MNRDQKIAFINEKLAKKDLTFGCRVKIFWEKLRVVNAEYPHHDMLQVTRYKEARFSRDEYIIIWHPIMLWRALEVLIEKWPDYLDDCMIILDLRTKKEESIEKQYDTCIDFIFNCVNLL